MEEKNMKEKNTHHGHAVKRLRQTLGVKQETLAKDLGISQVMISKYEAKKEIDDQMMEKIAKALGVKPQLIKELEEDPVTVIVENNNNTFGDNDSIKLGNGIIEDDHSVMNVNPVEQIVELCEKLLEKDQEKITLLEKLLNSKK
ncbi:MAG: helix-turn-helix transcriptional regulator [Prevotella sp.]|jgi:transcriptional regulator with XRE-family HTH domain|nr:helix-turn-helix transcriptional regulator [Prevotella sp.]